MISLHPLYYNATTNNNYALLHMKEDFVLGPSVDVICLPKQPTAVTEADFDSTACVAMGWGKSKYGKIHCRVCIGNTNSPINE